jgi:hypothetical protein
VAVTTTLRAGARTALIWSFLIPPVGLLAALAQLRRFPAAAMVTDRDRDHRLVAKFAAANGALGTTTLTFLAIATVRVLRELKRNGLLEELGILHYFDFLVQLGWI